MTPTARTRDVVVLDNAERPVATVVVLAWRLSTGLIDCLRALSRSVNAPAHEVVVVLNGASTAVRESLQDHVESARIVDLAENVGFGGGCNAAALVARGEYLILLNDDAEVHENWLAEIVSSAEDAGESTAAVASLLLNTDGTVQEAGCRVLGHAGTTQFGRGMTLAEALDAGLLVDRSVDYGSGAALLIRRSAFVAVGGFDSRYEPAYYEDVDLCFRLRAAGHDVIIHPAARVTHASGGSTSADARFRKFAADRSGSRFYARWQRALESAPREDAPLDQLCDPLLAGEIADAPLEIRDPSDSSVIALDISRAYAVSLASDLSVAEERLLIEQKLREADLGNIDDLKAERDGLRDRLESLERGNPLLLIRWRLGILRRRFRLRRELSALRHRA